MQVSDQWNWGLFDFVWAAVVLWGAVFMYEWVARKGRTTVFRAAVGLAVVTALVLVWINAAVGVIGDGVVRLRQTWPSRGAIASAMAEAMARWLFLAVRKRPSWGLVL